MKRNVMMIIVFLLIVAGISAQELYLTSRVGVLSSHHHNALQLHPSFSSTLSTPVYSSASSGSAFVSRPSVNMRSGSSYTIQLTEIGSAVPATIGNGISPRRLQNNEGDNDGPPTDGDNYNPNSPQFGPINDGIYTLLIMLLLYVATLMWRRKRSTIR